MRETDEQKAERLMDRILWLANDCGGCETCGRVFSVRMHDEAWREVAELPEEHRRRFDELR